MQTFSKATTLQMHSAVSIISQSEGELAAVGGCEAAWVAPVTLAAVKGQALQRETIKQLLGLTESQ